jgi:hypothetical protein
VSINKTVTSRRCEDLGLQLVSSFNFPTDKVYNGTFYETFTDELPIMFSDPDL